ncbi:MAG: hypothetical protein D6772_05230, partial [Bacteroidetes bacterium]
MGWLFVLLKGRKIFLRESFFKPDEAASHKGCQWYAIMPKISLSLSVFSGTVPGLPANPKINQVPDMSFEVKGKLHKKFDTENKTETFQAREFVI